MNLGKKILNIRKDNKMSQEEFAEVLNVSRQTVSNWENYKNYPDIETLILISNKFNISLDILLKGEDKMIKDIDKKVKEHKTLKRIIIILISIISLFAFLLILGIIWLSITGYFTVSESGEQRHIWINKCNLNNLEYEIQVEFYVEKNEDGAYESQINKKAKDYNLIGDNYTKILQEMNINKDLYSAKDLAEYMTNYFLNKGGTCTYKEFY